MINYSKYSSKIIFNLTIKLGIKKHHHFITIGQLFPQITNLLLNLSKESLTKKQPNYESVTIRKVWRHSREFVF